MTSSQIVLYGHGYLTEAIENIDDFMRSFIIDHRELLRFENDLSYLQTDFNGMPMNSANYTDFTPAELVLAHLLVLRIKAASQRLAANWTLPAVRANAQAAVLAQWHQHFSGVPATDLVLFACSALWVNDGVQAVVRCNQRTSPLGVSASVAVIAPRWFHQLLQFVTDDFDNLGSANPANPFLRNVVGPALPVPSEDVLVSALTLWTPLDFSSMYSSLAVSVAAAERV